MINYIRLLLKNNKYLYDSFGKFYHLFKDILVQLSMIFKEAKYLKPLNIKQKYKSQYGQDYYLEKFGFLKKNGYFVEVGCNHPIFNSNSYYLEKYYQYKGLSIDPLNYKPLYKKYRPRTKFINALIDNSNNYLNFHKIENNYGWENQMSSLHKNFIRSGKNFKYKVIKVKSLPLNKLVNKKIDILMIDVEGHEFKVLNSLNFKKTDPNVILVENSGDYFKKNKMENYMSNRNYKLFARIGSADDIYIKKK